jgi:mutator protein MutT
LTGPFPMLPADHFRHCPRCGAALAAAGANPLRCSACDFTFYFNPTVAAAAFVQRPDGRYVFIRRERDPAKGKLTVPGGFVDAGETAEEALVREVREEVGLTIADVRYVCSLTNRYLYREVTYPVCDLMFRATAVDPDAAVVGDGATAVVWARLEDLNPDELAFPSVRRGRELLLGT